MKSNKIIGILLLLIYVCVATALLNDAFIKPYNLQNLLRSSSMFAIIGVGAVMVIVTGGIDLSTGSLIGLVGCTMTMTLKAVMAHPPADNGAWLLQIVGWELIGVGLFWVLWESVWNKNPLGKPFGFGKLAMLGAGGLLLLGSLGIRQVEMGPWLSVAVAVTFALLLSAHLGLLHGLLITQLKLQPFVVTLCGLMCYRGLSRWLTSDQTQGLGTAYNDSLRLLAIGKPCTATFVLLLGSVVLMLVGLWKLIFPRVGEVVQSRAMGGLVFAFGLILAVVSSSRYWDGWEVVYSGDTFFSLAGYDFRFFTLELEKVAIARPATLMGFAIYPLVVCLLALTGLQVRSWFQNSSVVFHSKFRQVAAAVLVVGSLLGIYFIKGWIGSEAVTLSQMDPTLFWGLSLTYWKIGGIFLAMAGLISGVMWMEKTWLPHLGLPGRLVWLASGFFAVLWLLSRTAIHETVVQTPFFLLVVIGTVAAIFLNKTVSGRYLMAMGNNEEAARYSGINTDRMKILAYVLCGICGGIGAVLFTLDSNNVEPSGHGSFYELYAIAAAVLGGCSLRGGEGSILGVIIGASIMRVLYNAPDMIGISSQLEMFTIGIVILIGVIVDESARRIAAHRDRKMA